MSWKAEYVVLIMISTLVDYISGIQIYNAKSPKKKKLFLILSLMTNLGLLFTFKYFNFFSDSFRLILQQLSIQINPTTLKVLLPVGISFYTFQEISYTIDVYRGKLKPQKHLGLFAVYVAFFPQLVAGPIERAKHLLPQFIEKHYFDYKRVTDGLKLMLWGFFKKVVIADRLATVVNAVYNNPTDYTGAPLLVATVFFTFQIYCDFSGYSDIAIGTAQVMGFKLMNNFKRPYFSRSISEFWKRWHISLSSWFRDYLYIPLGGSKVSVPRWYLNILVVFLVSGLWHGANWTFVAWGGLHGLYLISERIAQPVKNYFLRVTKVSKSPKLVTILEIGFTFILVNIGWIFFRANNIKDALYILSSLFSNWSLSTLDIDIGFGYLYLLFCLGLIALMELIHLKQERESIREFINSKSVIFRWSVYLATCLFIVLFGVFGNTQFIYFQF